MQNNNIDKKISKYFQKKHLVDLITKYELYYHISLSSFVFETLLDITATTKKLQELNLKISVNQTMENIYKVIKEHHIEENLEKNLESYIREKASINALNDFIEKDKEFLGAKFYRIQKENDILNDKLFNKNMQTNFETNYQKTYEHYDLVINEKYIKNIQNQFTAESSNIC